MDASGNHVYECERVKYRSLDCSTDDGDVEDDDDDDVEGDDDDVEGDDDVQGD